MICPKCKKPYNYDANFGICPKCGSFNHLQESNSAFAAASKPSSATEEDIKKMEENYEQEKLQNEVKDYEKLVKEREALSREATVNVSEETRQKKGVRRARAIFFAAFASLILIFGYFDAAEDRIYSSGDYYNYHAQTLFEDVTTEEKDSDEGILMVTETGAKVTVISASVIAHSKASSALPEGTKLIGVLLQGDAADMEYSEIREMELQNDYSVGDVFFVSYNDSECRRAFISSGINSNTDFSFGGREDFDGYTALRSTYDCEGYVYFVVPEEVDSFEFCLQQRSATDNTVKKIFKIPVVLIDDEGVML